jgi:hypothetical protein
MPMLSGIIRALSGLCMVAIGVGMLVSAEDIEPLALKVFLFVTALCSAALGVYVLAPHLRRGKSKDGTEESA